MNTVDTIAAICTGVGGAISIVRISGDNALTIGNKIWRGSSVLNHDNKRKMLLGSTISSSSETGDTAMAVFMPNPHSYTGEDVVEIHGHGGMLATKELLRSALDNGARLADPGEFSYRAFINGKMDLTQAEAVCDIINAHSSMALHLAEKQISGTLGTAISAIRERLIHIRADLESRMDFADVELDWTSNNEFIEQLYSSVDKLTKLWNSKNEGALLRDGLRVVIAGKPNVGKSSLLNRLLGFDRAIVTDIAGTTRDTLEEFATIRNIPVKVIDTAGIREADNIVEGIGIERSKKSMESAQVVFWLLDADSDDLANEISELNDHINDTDKAIVIWNKIDKVNSAESLPKIDIKTAYVSVLEDTGIEEFLDMFESMVWGFKHTEEPEFAVSERHAKHLDASLGALPQAIICLQNEEMELAAVHLRDAIAELGSITGEDIDPDLLDNIFSRFCLGK